MPPKADRHPRENQLIPKGNAVINYYEHIPKDLLDEAENPNYALHQLKLPFRAIIVAPSGSGKTNFLTNLLHMFCAGKGTFADIAVVTRNADEPLYNWLKEKGDGLITVKEGLQNLPHLDSFDKKENHLVVIDDLVLTKNQEAIEAYYIRARKLSTSVIYISQSYFRIPKIIRQNLSYLFILKLGGDRDMRLILTEFGLGIDKDCMVRIYEYCTAEKFNTLTIDMEADKSHRLRHNYLEIIDPNRYGNTADSSSAPEKKTSKLKKKVPNPQFEIESDSD